MSNYYAPCSVIRLDWLKVFVMRILYLICLRYEGLKMKSQWIKIRRSCWANFETVRSPRHFFTGVNRPEFRRLCMNGWMDEEANGIIIELSTCLAVQVLVNFYINIWNALKDETLKSIIKVRFIYKL